MKPTRALALIESTASHHRYGHHCHDGQWYNQRTGDRTPCQVVTDLETAAAEVTQLHAQVHEAAHDEDTVAAVTRGMLADTDLTDLPADVVAGWVMMARLAIEALAVELDRDPVQEARVIAAQERLAVSGG